MDRCNFCRNILIYGENHACSFLTIDSTYSHSQPFSENTFNSGQLGIHCELPSFDIFSDISGSYPQTYGDASSTGSSENNEFWYRPENDYPESFNISPVVMVSTGVGMEVQRGSGISDLIIARGRAEDEMSRQEYRWLSWNNDIMNYMDSTECVIRTDHSDSSLIPGPRNLVMNPDFLSGSNEPVNGKKHFSEYVTDGRNSLEMHSDVYSKSRKTASTVKQRISSETDKSAVAGPSGMWLCKKKYPCTLCPMEFNGKSNFENHYRTHTREKPFVCKVCENVFTQKGNLNRHIRTHTGAKTFECEVCKKSFSEKSNLEAHHRTHAGETHFLCKVCKEAFSRKSALIIHVRTHTGERPYKCTVCGKAFRTSSHPKRHQREMH